MKKIFTCVIIFTLVFGGAQIIFGHGPAKGNTSIAEKHCTSCHELGKALNKRRSDTEWKEIVNRMINYGLEISSSEKKKLLDFLINNYQP